VQTSIIAHVGHRLTSQGEQLLDLVIAGLDTLGLPPRVSESVGKAKKAAARKGDQQLRPAMVESEWTAGHTRRLATAPSRRWLARLTTTPAGDANTGNLTRQPRSNEPCEAATLAQPRVS
jgi:hypothetical protein